MLHYRFNTNMRDHGLGKNNKKTEQCVGLQSFPYQLVKSVNYTQCACQFGPKSALPRYSERAHAYLESQQYSRADPEIKASNAGVPPANDIAHAEHDASSADPLPANALVQSGINGADAVAQIQVPTSSLEIVPSASNNGSAAKVRDDSMRLFEVV